MTHDELLDKILMECGCRNTKALRAIVELHKPDIYETCVECTRGISPSISYPCPTIQAIKKELG